MGKRTVYLYCPDHPEASEHGHVEAWKAHAWKGAQASSPAPHYISDIMPETRHMADGQLYTSKSQFRKTTKAYGCVEIGNELPTMNKPRPHVELNPRQRRDDIRRAFWEVKNGRRASQERD